MINIAKQCPHIRISYFVNNMKDVIATQLKLYNYLSVFTQLTNNFSKQVERKRSDHSIIECCT